MDQVRVALAWIKRYHFWLLCGLVAFVSAGTWYLASGELSASFDKNSKSIKSQFDKSNRVRSQPFHANAVINSEQSQQNSVLADQVRTLWTQLYEGQREKVLQWPEQLDDDFIRRVEGASFGDPIPVSLRRRYQNYIQEYYPELPKIVQAAESTRRSSGGASPGGSRGGFGSRSGFGGGGFGSRGGLGGALESGFGGISTQRRGSQASDTEAEEENYLVIWADQERIREQLELIETPSALRMWVTQEDLWVYETLLRAIAGVNTAAKADRYSNAAIRDIVAMEVGQLATNERTGIADRLYKPEATIGGSSVLGPGASLSESSALSGRGGGGLEAGGEGDEASELLTNRYISGDGTPEPVTPGSYKFGTEFKRLPVRLEMRMDQRWLPQLIAELSNAPLQVEVTEVRVNPDSGNGGGTQSRSRALSSADDKSVRSFSREPTLGDVILRGIVFIYNPVDEQALPVDNDSA